MSEQCVGDRRQSQAGVVVINTSLGRGSFPIPVQMSESNFPISYTLTVTTDAISKFPNGATPGLMPSRLTAIIFLVFFFIAPFFKLQYLTNLTLRLHNLREMRAPVKSFLAPILAPVRSAITSIQRRCNDPFAAI